MGRGALGAEKAGGLDSEPFYVMHRPRLYAFVRRRLNGREDDAEDIVQETFAEFFRSKPKAPITNPAALLARIALCLIARRGSQETRQVVTYDSERVDALVEEGADGSPDTLADDLCLRNQMERAKAQLTREEWLAVHHCKGLGHTYEEAATATGLSVHMVEKHLINAMALIRDMKWDW
jgi:RNA polymerase sigma factor (sigma-70 family)